MTCLWSLWDWVAAPGVGVAVWDRSLGAQIAQLAAAQRWRDEDRGERGDVGRRESRGGELKGTEARRGALDVPPLGFSLLWITSLLLSLWHSGPQFGLPWRCHGNREASKTRHGRVELREGRRKFSIEASPPRLAVVIILWEEGSRCSVDSILQFAHHQFFPSSGSL